MTQPKILIVDDNEENRLILCHALRQEPYQLEQAVDGRSALDHAIAQQPDLILLDVVMPRLNGLAVLRLLKSHKATKKIPVIMVTGLSMDVQVENYLNAGATDSISKPFSSSIVCDKIRKALGLAQPSSNPDESLQAETKDPILQPLTVEATLADETPNGVLASPA